MYTIGEFAALGHVSARMLRHYDAIGLVRPADVDPSSGYRRYENAQLGDLLRVVELRDYGCSLDDAAVVLGADDVDAAMRAALDRRRSELTATIADEHARLARLERRLSLLEGTTSMSDITYRSVDPITVYAASAVVGEHESTPDVIERLLPALQSALDAAGAAYREPAVFWYRNEPGTDALRIHVSWPADGDARPGDGYDVVALPAIERAATLTHRGDVASIGAAWNALTQGVLANGDEPIDGCREIYLQSEPSPRAAWVTELVQAVR